MSENKISIDIQEYENITLTPDNAVGTSEGKGSLNILNTSDSNRLWNAVLTLDETVLTGQLERTYKRDALEPNQIWNFEYHVPNLQKPILRLEEIIDTSEGHDGINNNYALKEVNIVSFKITLENTTETAIEDIVLQKQLPDYMKELKVTGADVGNHELDLNTRAFVWKIDSLAPNQKTSLEISGRGEINDSGEKSGNDINVDYKSFMVSRSGLVPSIEALTDTMTGIDSEEDDSKPGWWNCTLEFENESDFELTIKNVVVSRKIASGIQDIVNEAPNVIVAPKSEWTHKFSLESVNVPALTPKLEFTANYDVAKQINGHITKQASTFQVLETSVEKELNPPTVNANANTDMTFTDTITNQGTANIDCIEIVDTIPRDFETPELTQITAYIANPLGEKDITLRQENSKLSISPQDKDLTNPHDIKMEFMNLAENFKPGYKLVVSYPIVARNPQPDAQYDTPIKTVVYSKPRGPGFNKTTEEMPNINIAYVKRKISTAKSITPSGQEGVFAIRIKIRNKGGVELQNMTVEEIIPKGFKAVDFRPENLKPEFQEFAAGDDSKLIWQVPMINAGDSLSLEYNCQGVGDFPRFEPKIMFAETAAMKGKRVPKAPIAPPKDEPAAAPTEDKGPSIITESSPVVADTRLKCPNCGSNKIDTREDRDNPISYMSGTPIYGKKYACKSCGWEFK